MLKFIRKLTEDKREYKRMMARVGVLPEDYQFVFKKIQSYMWNFAAGAGYDMLKIQYDLIDLLESGASKGNHILEVTGEDVAAFCDDLLINARTYTDTWREKLNRVIMNKVGGTK